MTSPTSTNLSRHSQRLLQIGAALLLYSFFEGFAIPYFASPRIGLSVHTLSALEAVLLLVLGLVWPRLVLGPTSATLAFWVLVYSALAILAAYTIAATWGVGIDTIRLRENAGHGLQGPFLDMQMDAALRTWQPGSAIPQFSLPFRLAREMPWCSQRGNKAQAVRRRVARVSR